MKNYDVDSIQEYLIFEGIGGSTAYGTNLPTSDIDKKGVYILPLEEILSGNYQEQVNDTTNDTVYYELNKFIRLAAKGNPNILEMLNFPKDCIIKTSTIWEAIVAYTPKFITKSCKEAFGGYAIAQIKKAKGLKKKAFNPMPKERKGILDFCYVSTLLGTVPFKSWVSRQRKFCKQSQYGAMKADHARDLYYIYPAELGFTFRGLVKCDDSSNELRVTSIPEALSAFQIPMIYNRDSYIKYCKDYKEYWDWVAKRNPERYENTMRAGQGYDCKNMMHCMRLIRMGKELATEGTINVRRSDREYLLDIRKGKKMYKEILENAEQGIKELDEAFDSCDLPERLSQDKVDELILVIRMLHYNI